VYPAPVFFDVDFVTGAIRLKSSVSNDNLLTTTYYVGLLAYDTAYPTIYGSATATINVNRNPNSPAFVNRNCRASISESFQLGNMIFNSTAVDLDGVCCLNVPF